MFTSPIEHNKASYDLPAYVLSAIEQVVEICALQQQIETTVIGDQGVWITNNATEIAHMNSARPWLLTVFLKAMDNRSGNHGNGLADAWCVGQHTSVVTITPADLGLFREYVPERESCGK